MKKVVFMLVILMCISCNKEDKLDSINDIPNTIKCEWKDVLGKSFYYTTIGGAKCVIDVEKDSLVYSYNVLYNDSLKGYVLDAPRGISYGKVVDIDNGQIIVLYKGWYSGKQINLSTFSAYEIIDGLTLYDCIYIEKQWTQMYSYDSLYACLLMKINSMNL